MIELKKIATPTYKLCDSVKTAIDILDHMEGFEVAKPFWVTAMKVLENETKRIQWLQMSEAAR